MSAEIIPFRIEIPEADVDDLRERLRRTRWPDAETVDDWSQGIPLSYTRDLCQYWLERYDWRACEASLNRFPQFRTSIDGLDIHFLHVRSPQADALPLVMTHGWPGSIIEFRKVIGPLTDPVAHGGDAADAFHVVCPSLPGFGFSGKPAMPGWGIEHIADAWAQLMTRLGYPRYGAQGGDWGSGVTVQLGVRHPDDLAGIHLNMAGARPDPATMNDLTEQEKDALAAMKHYQDWDSGYSKQQSTRPQTVGYGLVDSPAGLCAWIVEKFWSWTDSDGDPANVLTRDEMLDNVMLYWLPGTGASSARLYWESFGKLLGGTVQVPVGCSIFPKEIVRPSRRWAEKAYPDLRYWNELPKGGHFAAFEQPATFVDEVRAAFRAFRAG
ncbi:MAG TPA: epoxide hydrolase [Streptosporangiaceae bacterium]|nr:epoxide hydrolase [Streptosporangiaceae bacterium]